MFLPNIPDDLKGGIEIRLEDQILMDEYLHTEWKSALEQRGFSVKYVEANGTTEPFRCVRVKKKEGEE